MPATTPFPLLTVRRIAELTQRPVSFVQDLLDEHTDIQPTAIADYRPVYDRDAFLRVLSLIDQAEAKGGCRVNDHTPPSLAAEYGCSPETIIAHIKAGRLKAFTLSPPHCRRPRWRISAEAVAEFERVYGNVPATKRQSPSRRKPGRDFVEYV